MITEYLIVEHSNPSKLSILVKECMKEGWEPLGGVSVTTYVESDGAQIFLYVQAIVKTDNAVSYLRGSLLKGAE